MHTVRPWVKRWEAELDRKLIPEAEKGRLRFRFNLDSLLRGDTANRAKLIDTYMKWGITNRDEIRSLEGFNNIQDGSGQKYFVPMNMVNGNDEEE